MIPRFFFAHDELGPVTGLSPDVYVLDRTGSLVDTLAAVDVGNGAYRAECDDAWIDLGVVLVFDGGASDVFD